MKSPDYLAINPMGKVPAIRHRGQVVTECAAICAYLADAFPEAGLAPTPAERAGYYRWLFFAAGPVEAAVTAHAMGAEPQDERQQGMAGYGRDRESVVEGKRVSVRLDLGGRRIIKKTKHKTHRRKIKQKD